ncbi:MAG: T9SS type A sorting domain-containing protein [Bacteroidetes bacterium]|nr:T9SS type A sorting domain-containing protein [Bacteroidota bacterium]
MRYICLLILLMLTLRAVSQITVDTSFEGSNARVLSVNNSSNTLKIESVLKRGDVYNVVFYLKVLNVDSTRTFRLQVQYSQLYFLPVYVMYSYDKSNWYRLSGTVSGNYEEYSGVFNRRDIYFCYGYPYVYSDVINLQNSLSSNPFVTVSDVSYSESGRAVKLFRITNSTVSDSGKSLIWVTGRHHAMESNSNYVVEGLINYLASADVNAARLRNQAIIYVVPVMDVDMVYAGGTGKDQNPVDFNRDWDSPSHWNAVRDVKAKILQTAASNRLRVFLDSHDPFPGETDTSGRNFFFSMQESGQKSVNLNAFRNKLYNTGGYWFGRKPLYPTSGQTSTKWVDSMFANMDFSASLETGWTKRTDGTSWSVFLYRLHGGVLGRGLSDYIYQSTSVSENGTPVNFYLNVYPNPFNPKVKFDFSLRKNQQVKLYIYDVNGREIAYENFGKLNSGRHEYVFDAEGLSSGVYFYRIETTGQDGLLKGRIVLIK